MKTEKEKAAGLQMITVDQTTFPVEVRNGRLAINLTAMGKKYGKQKQPSNWLRTDEARRYLDALSKLQKCGLADLVEVRNGGIPGLNGTWCYDRRIAVRYAQFLDEILAIKVDTLLIDMLEGVGQQQNPPQPVGVDVNLGGVRHHAVELLHVAEQLAGDAALAAGGDVLPV